MKIKKMTAFFAACVVLLFGVWACSDYAGREALKPENISKIASPTSYLFREDTAFSVRSYVTNLLGVQSMVIDSGDYQITFTESQYGVTYLRILSITDDQTPGFLSPSIRIHIARKKKCGCTGCFGFSCGWSPDPLPFPGDPFPRETEDRLNPMAQVSVIQNNGQYKLRITFLESVPFGTPGWGYDN